MRRLLIGGSPDQGRCPASEVNDGACPEKPVLLSPYGAAPVAAALSPAGPPGGAFEGPSDRPSSAAAGHWHPGLLGASGPPVQETAPAHTTHLCHGMKL